MLREHEVEQFVKTLDKISAETIAAIKSKEDWIVDSEPTVQDAIEGVSGKLHGAENLNAVSVDLAVQLFSRLKVERSLLLLRLFSDKHRSMIYKALNVEQLNNEQLKVYQTVFIQRLLILTRTSVTATIFSQQRTAVISDYLNRIVSFKIAESENGEEESTSST